MVNVISKSKYEKIKKYEAISKERKRARTLAKHLGLSTFLFLESGQELFLSLKEFKKRIEKSRIFNENEIEEYVQMGLEKKKYIDYPARGGDNYLCLTIEKTEGRDIKTGKTMGLGYSVKTENKNDILFEKLVDLQYG